MTALPPTQHLDRPDGRLAFDDTGGDGPLIVCVPGLGDLRSEHRFLRPLLVDAGWRVVTMDLRGHGESSVEWPSYAPEAVGDDIVALLAHLDAVRANLAEPGRGRALRRMLAAPKTACEARMPEVAVPALVVMGTADPDFDDPAAEAAAVAAGVRGEVLLVDGAGHYPHVEQPERVAAAITDLVAGGGR